ncbi:MAG: hypothetical protein IMY71_11485 [Bacteroidetes bacterium]|nr:hypothetical protein [Bacteroidota bacterium]
MNKELFLALDVVKAVLLKRMEREAKLILHDEFLTDKQRMAGFTLYREIGADFVAFIESLHAIKLPTFLFLVAQKAIENFQDSLDLAWIWAYDGHLPEGKKINWLNS